MSSGFFNNCDIPRTGPGASNDPELQGSVASIVVVTPVRSQDERPTYVEQMKHFYSLCKSPGSFRDK
jgi:hypothetical protein